MRLVAPWIGACRIARTPRAMMPHTDDAPSSTCRGDEPCAPRRRSPAPCPLTRRASRSEGTRPRRRRDRRDAPPTSSPAPATRSSSSSASPAPGLETSFANAGEVSPGYSAPWAGPGVPLKAIKWLAMHHRPLVIRPNIDWSMIRWSLAMLRNCTAARYASTRRAWCAWPNTAATACAPCARRPGSPTTSACAARCSSFAPRSSSTAAPATSPFCARAASPSSCSTAPAASATSRRSRACSEKFVGGLLLPGDETGDCFEFTQRLAELAAAARRRLPLRDDDPRDRRGGDRITGVTTDSGVVDCRRLPGRARQLLAAAARADRRPHPGLPGQGLLDHRADRRCRRRARVDGDGRDAQGRGDAPRRPHPRRRHRRARRLHAAPARRAAQDAGPRRQRSLSRRRRHRPRRVLVRPQADDARRHAGDRRDADRQPLPRHRPRHARLDDGGRHRAGDGRPDLGAQPRASSSTG